MLWTLPGYAQYYDFDIFIGVCLEEEGSLRSLHPTLALLGTHISTELVTMRVWSLSTFTGVCRLGLVLWLAGDMIA